jgi:hypothetical protein
MEFVWVIMGNLQLINCLTQFDLKLPLNLETMTQSFSDISNLNFLQLRDLYVKLRRLVSDSEMQDVNIWGNYVQNI